MDLNRRNVLSALAGGMASRGVKPAVNSRQPSIDIGGQDLLGVSSIQFEDGTEQSTAWSPDASPHGVAFSTAYHFADSGSGTKEDPYVNAIANAYDHLPSGGGFIYVPGPAWYEETDFTVDDKPLHLKGAGKGITTITDGGSSAATLQATLNPTGDPQTDFLTVEDLSFHVNDKTVDAIFSDTNRHTFRNLYINTARDAFRFDGVVDMTLERIYAHGNDGYGMHFVGDTSTTVTVQDSVFRTNTRGIDTHAPAQNLRLRDSIFEKNDRTGVRLQRGGHNATIDGCWFERNNQEDVGASNLRFDLGSFATLSATIKGCSFGGSEDAPANHVAVSNCEGVRFEGCRFGSSATNLIVQSDAKKVRAVECDFQGPVVDNNTLVDGNLVRVETGHDPTADDYDVTKWINGAIITDGSAAWVVTDETDSDGVVAI